jgi:hypothetical protein
MAPDLAAAVAASLLAVLALASGATLRAPKGWYLGIALALTLLTFALVWLLALLRYYGDNLDILRR